MEESDLDSGLSGASGAAKMDAEGVNRSTLSGVKKRGLKQYKCQHRLAQAGMLKERMALLCCSFLQTPSESTFGEVSVPNMPMQLPQQQVEQPGTSGSIDAGAAGGGGCSSEKSNPQICLKKQMLAILKMPNTPERHALMGQFLFTNPLLQAALLKRRQAEAAKQSQAANAGQGPGGVMVPNQEPQHLLPQQQQPGDSMDKNPPMPALKQLIGLLRSPNSPERHAQILEFLKSNPQVMVEFIRRRQAFYLAQATNQSQATSAVEGSAEVMMNQQPQHLLAQQQPPGMPGSAIAGGDSLEESEIEKYILQEFETLKLT